jgi:ATP-dependent Lhr-like helicase
VLKKNNFTQKAKPALAWFAQQGWEPFVFQTDTWAYYWQGKSGLVNAPTGSGKTYSLLVPAFIEGLEGNSDPDQVQVIWITPIRALAKEIYLAANRLKAALNLSWDIAIRSGDTSTKERQKQKSKPPALLITTPESLHLLLAQKNQKEFFGQLKAIVIDEWHELLGSKRGVQVELALSRIKKLSPSVKIWGISATIGNMDQAKEVLLGSWENKAVIVRANIKKVIEIESVFPDEVERMPWAGHLGIHLLEKVVALINQSTSTLVFTNTRSFAEIWYQKLLDFAPELSGQIAMHHGSVSQELRTWVEEQLHAGKLKAVVCTSSLDLGVDFRPVETVIQIGSPKGVARFLQRAGRSGHQPGAISKIHFVPTHSLELVESAALRQAVQEGIIEDRLPYMRSFDVLVQYLVTLAVGGGFKEDEIWQEIKETFSYNSLSREEWVWVLQFIVSGGDALQAYDEYRKVELDNGVYKVESRKIALRHRMSIGTIVGDSSVLIKYQSGKLIGTIEEYFITRLKPGDVFWFAGRSLELIRFQGMEAHVRNSKKKTGLVPSWQGGRMPLSSQLSAMVRQKMQEVKEGNLTDKELSFLKPLFELQTKHSVLPGNNELLIEYFETAEGYHLVLYPFEGRSVHEGLGALLAYRIGQIKPLSFSIGMTDYGVELLSAEPIPVQEALEENILSTDNLLIDIQASINATEMAKRKFRDIAAISGLIFKGFPGHAIKDRHLQSSTQLFFTVFTDYEASNLLLQQAYSEVLEFQLEENRLRQALARMATQKIMLKFPERPTPFAFPIMVDRLREKLSTESLESQVRKMIKQFQD